MGVVLLWQHGEAYLQGVGPGVQEHFHLPFQSSNLYLPPMQANRGTSLMKNSPPCPRTTIGP